MGIPKQRSRFILPLSLRGSAPIFTLALHKRPSWKVYIRTSTLCSCQWHLYSTIHRSINSRRLECTYIHFYYTQACSTTRTDVNPCALNPPNPECCTTATHIQVCACERRLVRSFRAAGFMHGCATGLPHSVKRPRIAQPARP